MGWNDTKTTPAESLTKNSAAVMMTNKARRILFAP